MFTVSNDESYLYEAIRFAQFGCSRQSNLISIPDHPLSLFEGIAGSCVLMDGLLSCMKNYEYGVETCETHFPGFDLNLFK